MAECATRGRDHPGLLFGYGAIPTNRVEEGLGRIHEYLSAGWC
jgi:hypothetical protein